MYTLDNQQKICLLTALNKDGVDIKWREEVSQWSPYWRRKFPHESPATRYVEIGEVPRNVDPEWLGRWLADYFSDWFEVGVDCNDSDNRAWDEIEDMFGPDATRYKTLTGYKATKWWATVRAAYDGLFEECMVEWKAEMMYGHPSLTAAERNPGLR